MKKTKTVSFLDYLETPIGLLCIEASNEGLSAVAFTEKKNKTPIKINTITKTTTKQLQEYFSGKRKVFALPLDTQGTDFQQSVWQALTHIPFGQTESYSGLAKKINKPKAVRAVGAANGRNPLSIIVPCHRVIGANNTLTGYAWGLERKQWLLEHEKAL